MNRQDLLNYLKGLTNTGKILSGQHLDESDPQGSYDALVAPLPDVPAILGGSPRVGASDDLSPNETLFSILGDHASKGGVVMLEAHFANPWVPSNEQDIGTAWVTYPNVAKPDLTTLATVNGVSPAYLSFWAQVDRLIDGIKTLPADALIILRLLHEANGTWFWWGQDQTKPGKDQEQIQLLTQLKRYVTSKVKQTPLWMHSGSGMSYYAPTAFGRPDWVDLVGASLYTNDLSWVHPQDLADLKTAGKPILLAEAGPDVSKPQPGTWDTTCLERLDPAIVGFQTWQDYNGLHVAAVSNQHWQEVYANPKMITRSKLPQTPPTPPEPTPPPHRGPVPNPLPRFLGPF